MRAAAGARKRAGRDIARAAPRVYVARRAVILRPAVESRVNKSELIAALAARAALPKAVASRAVEALFAPGGVIAGELKKGNKVQVTGFGHFEVRRREARKGRDPRTGKEIAIGSTVAAVFRAGRGLNDAIGKRGSRF